MVESDTGKNAGKIVDAVFPIGEDPLTVESTDIYKLADRIGVGPDEEIRGDVESRLARHLGIPPPRITQPPSRHAESTVITEGHLPSTERVLSRAAVQTIVEMEMVATTTG